MLTNAIAKKIREETLMLESQDTEDVGERRKLRIKFQNKYDLTEIEAINLMSGYHTKDYIRIHQMRKAEMARRAEDGEH